MFCLLCESKDFRKVGTIPISHGNSREDIVTARFEMLQCCKCSTITVDIDNATFMEHLKVCSHTDPSYEDFYFKTRRNYH